jgi:predicted nucleic acid-binding protein
MAKLYLDSNIVIRLVEQKTPAWQVLAAQLAALAGGDSLYVVSDLVHMECLVKPLALGDTAMRALYEAYLDTLDVVALTRSVCVRAAGIRARHRFGTPDALHLAAAIEAGCDAFVTSDRRLSGFPEIEVALIAVDAESVGQE